MSFFFVSFLSLFFLSLFFVKRIEDSASRVSVRPRGERVIIPEKAAEKLHREKYEMIAKKTIAKRTRFLKPSGLLNIMTRGCKNISVPGKVKRWSVVLTSSSLFISPYLRCRNSTHFRMSKYKEN